jgi:hypothetical protein
MTVLVCGADAGEILDALHGALLTDDELRSPQDWVHYDDPFGAALADTARMWD